MNLYETKCFIAAQLSPFGWEICDATSLAHFCGVASKWYETAVGPKSALIIMEPSFDGLQTLKSEYWSEGRNVLSTIVLKVDIKGDPEALAEAVKKLAEEIEVGVAQSYAVRLLRENA